MNFRGGKKWAWLARNLVAMAAFLGGIVSNYGVGHADTLINMENGSNNVLTVGENSYTLNGATNAYDGRLNIYFPPATSSNNQITINGGTDFLFTVGNFEMPYEANYNTVTVNGGTISSIYAGYTGSGNVTGNQVFINGGSTSGTIYNSHITAGSSHTGNVTDNHLYIYGGEFANATGGDSLSGDVSNNTVVMETGTVNGYILGGEAARDLSIDSTNTTSGDVTNNTVIVNDGTINRIEGGFITFTTYTEEIKHDFSSSANVANNNVVINGGTINSVVGGNAIHANVYNNSVDIYGGTINGSIVGGSSSVETGTTETYRITDNTINVYNTPDLSNASLTGYFAGSGELEGSSYEDTSHFNISGNTLNMHTKNITAKSVSNFNNVNFYLDSNIQNGDTMLTVSTANLDNSTVQAIVEGGTPLTDGDSVTLLNATNSLSANNTTYASTISEGVSFNYPVTVSRNGNSIVAQIGNASSGGGSSGGVSLEEQTDILPIPLLDAVSLLDRGTSRLIDWLPPDEIEAMDIQTATKFEPFVSMGGGSLHFDTGHGSSLDAKTGGINGGFGRSVMNSSGRLVFAPIFDYGQDSYQSYLQDGTHGGGNSKYWAGGFIARQMNNNGMYYEGSFRAGNVKTSFVTDDFLSGGNRIHDSYRSSAPCFAGHVRVGWRAPVTRRDIVDVYGIYSHSHINGMDAHLTSGETYHFDATDSGMLRIGGRLVKQLKEQQRFYTGIAYQYEFSGDATGSYRGYETRKSSLSGSSGMIELGWQIKPTETSPLMLDVNATGWAGQQRGVTFQIKLKKAF